MRFHTDENIAKAIAAGLRRRGVDATDTPIAQLLGASDEEQLEYCCREGRVMVSHDPDMLRLAKAGVTHAGLVFCPDQKYKNGPLILKILLLASRFSDEQMRNRVEFL